MAQVAAPPTGLPIAEEEDDGGDEDDDYASIGARKKVTVTEQLTEDQEQELVDFFAANPI